MCGPTMALGRGLVMLMPAERLEDDRYTRLALTADLGFLSPFKMYPDQK